MNLVQKNSLISNTSSFATNNNGVTSMQYSLMNSNTLGAGYEDGSVVLWDCNKEHPTVVFKYHESMCTSVILSPINLILMGSGGLDSNLNLYDTATRK